MEIEEFNKTGFSNKTKIEYQNNIYNVMAVDFDEALIGIKRDNDDEIYWIRCENCKYISPC